MMNKNTIWLLIILAVAVGTSFLYMNQEVPTPAPEEINTEMGSSDYVGITTAEAEAKAQADGTLFRVVEIDGAPQLTTKDFQEGRINATVEAEVVTSYSIESMSSVIKSGPETKTGTHDALIGMTTAEAEVYAAENTVDLRTGIIDGEVLFVTMDFLPGRITTEVENNAIVGYTVE
jgi:hypothetical protein